MRAIHEEVGISDGFLLHAFTLQTFFGIIVCEVYVVALDQFCLDNVLIFYGFYRVDFVNMVAQVPFLVPVSQRCNGFFGSNMSANSLAKRSILI